MPKKSFANKLKWVCRCGQEAFYHVGGDGKHEYYCHIHWGDKLGYERKKTSIKGNKKNPKMP